MKKKKKKKTKGPEKKEERRERREERGGGGGEREREEKEKRKKDQHDVILMFLRSPPVLRYPVLSCPVKGNSYFAFEKEELDLKDGICGSFLTDNNINSISIFK